MDYIPIQSGAEQLQLAMWLFPLGSLVGGLMALLALTKGQDSPWKKAIFSTGAALGFLTVVGSVVLISEENPEAGYTPWKETLTASISESYGVQLTPDQFVALSYPSEEPEELTPLDYGTATLQFPTEAGVEDRKVTLHWDGAQMMLTAPDSAGTPQPLPLLTPPS
jgi:hypothetical protein